MIHGDECAFRKNTRILAAFRPLAISPGAADHELCADTHTHHEFFATEEGYEFFAKRALITLFSASNDGGEFDNAGAMMTIDDTLMCSFKVLKPAKGKK